MTLFQKITRGSLKPIKIHQVAETELQSIERLDKEIETSLRDSHLRRLQTLSTSFWVSTIGAFIILFTSPIIFFSSHYIRCMLVAFACLILSMLTSWFRENYEQEKEMELEKKSKERAKYFEKIRLRIPREQTVELETNILDDYSSLFC